MHMPNILVHIDEQTARRLKTVAPPRQRSRFVRLAIERALMAIDDLQTRKAYERHPDDGGSGSFDPGAWSAESWESVRPRRRKAR